MPSPSELQVNDKSKIVVTSGKDDDGKEYIDIRMHVETKKYTGPTGKGIRLPQDPVLLKALRKAILKHDINKE